MEKKTVVIECKGYGTVQRDFMKLKISVYAKCVYTLLRTYTGDKTACFPSLATITDNLGISKTTVLKAIKELEKIEMVAVKRSKKADSSQNMTNIYIPLSLMQEVEIGEIKGGTPDEPPSTLGVLGVVHQMDSNNNNVKNNIISTKVDMNTRKKSVKKEAKFIPPTLQEVKDYFKERGYIEETAITAFNYYHVADWKDGKGDQVKNWKQKMISVWMKPENKTTSTQKTFSL